MVHQHWKVLTFVRFLERNGQKFTKVSSRTNNDLTTKPFAEEPLNGQRRTRLMPLQSQEN